MKRASLALLIVGVLASFGMNAGGIQSNSPPSNGTNINGVTGDTTITNGVSTTSNGSHLGAATVPSTALATVQSAQGGSGVASPTAHGILVSEGASAFANLVCAADTAVMGVASADPACVALASCSASSSAVTYNTSTHAFGCNSVASASASGTLGDMTAGGTKGTMDNFSVNGVLNPMAPGFGNSGCTAASTPFSCCTGSGTGTCAAAACNGSGDDTAAINNSLLNAGAVVYLKPGVNCAVAGPITIGSATASATLNLNGAKLTCTGTGGGDCIDVSEHGHLWGSGIGGSSQGFITSSASANLTSLVTNTNHGASSLQTHIDIQNIYLNPNLSATYNNAILWIYAVDGFGNIDHVNVVGYPNLDLIRVESGAAGKYLNAINFYDTSAACSGQTGCIPMGIYSNGGSASNINFFGGALVDTTGAAPDLDINGNAASLSGSLAEINFIGTYIETFTGQTGSAVKVTDAREVALDNVDFNANGANLTNCVLLNSTSSGALGDVKVFGRVGASTCTNIINNALNSTTFGSSGDVNYTYQGNTNPAATNVIEGKQTITDALTDSVSVGTGTVPAVTAGTGGVFGATEGTAPTTSGGIDELWADSTGHGWKMQNNGGGATLVDGNSSGAPEFFISAGTNTYGLNTSFATGQQVAATTAINTGHFVNLTCTNIFHGATCTTAPTVNVFDGASNIGTTLTCSNALQSTRGTVSAQAQSLAFTAGDVIGLYISTQGGTCTSDIFSVTAQASTP